MNTRLLSAALLAVLLLPLTPSLAQQSPPPATEATEPTSAKSTEPPSNPNEWQAPGISLAGENHPRGDAEFKATLDRIAAEESKKSWDPSLVKFLTVAILTFGASVLGMMSYLVIKNRNTGQILRLFTVPLVIVASVFLVVTGYSNDQITPVVGLLGTIVGYILGANSNRSEPAPTKEPGKHGTEEK
jgi:hypothetical protein